MGPRMGIRGKRHGARRVLRPSLASMGPRMGIRGKVVRFVAAIPDTGELQWGRGWGSAERRVEPSASTAVPQLQWGRGWGSAESPQPANRNASYDNVLQWGRGWGSAERGLAAVQHRGASPASMGPRMGIRGKDAALATDEGSYRSFNGAADGDPRKAVISYSRVISASAASMGPRMGIRGKVTLDLELLPAAALQWGRGWGSAERGGRSCLLNAS